MNGTKVNGTGEGETMMNLAPVCCVVAPGGDVSVGTRAAAAHAAAGVTVEE